MDRLIRPPVFLPILIALAIGISIWFSRYRLPGADEGALLTNAMKLLRGGVFYRDIDAYPFPLATYLLALWMEVFGEHLSASRGLATLVFCVTVLSLYRASLRVLEPRRAALFGLSLLSFKFIAWPSFTSYFYWDVAFCLACVAVVLLLGHRFTGPTWRLAAAGLATGLALLTKQNVGIYLAAAAAVCLLLPGVLLGVRREGAFAGMRELLVFGGGLAAPMAIAAGYFASHGLLGAMLRSGLVRPFTGYLPTSGVPFIDPLAWWRLGQLEGNAATAYAPLLVWEMLEWGWVPGESWYPAYWLVSEIFSRALYTSVPVAFLAVAILWVCARWRGAFAANRSLFMLAALAGAVLLSAFPRADYPHVISVYPLVLLLLFALSGRLGAREGRAHPRLVAAEACALVAFLGAVVALSWIQHRHRDYRVQLERADVWVAPSQAYVASVVRYVEDETEEGEPLFVFGQEADYYFLTGRFFPWPFAQLYPGQTGDDGGRALLELVRSERPPLILHGMQRWPGLPLLKTHVGSLSRQLALQYERDTRVFERHPLPDGQPPPEWWVMSVLRPCEARVDCTPLAEFMAGARARK
jgi:hypothetical protein